MSINSTKPELNPNQLAFDLWQFLEWADQSELDTFNLELGELAGGHCPQGSAIKIGNLAEASQMIAFGGISQAFAQVEEAEERLANAETKVERNDVRLDVQTARYLQRILIRHHKRAEKTAEDIFTRIPY